MHLVATAKWVASFVTGFGGIGSKLISVSKGRFEYQYKYGTANSLQN